MAGGGGGGGSLVAPPPYLGGGGGQQPPMASAVAAPPAASVDVRAHPFISLAFARVLHANLGEHSPAAQLPCELVQDILERVQVDPIVVPGRQLGGAWTDNTSYYRIQGETMVLRSVWWLDVAIAVPDVPRGRFAVAVEMTAGSCGDIACTVRSRRSDQGEDAPWVAVHSYPWTRGVQQAAEGQAGRLELGVVSLEGPSTVDVRPFSLLCPSSFFSARATSSCCSQPTANVNQSTHRHEQLQPIINAIYAY